MAFNAVAKVVELITFNVVNESGRDDYGRTDNIPI